MSEVIIGCSSNTRTGTSNSARTLMVIIVVCQLQAVDGGLAPFSRLQPPIYTREDGCVVI